MFGLSTAQNSGTLLPPEHERPEATQEIGGESVTRTPGRLRKFPYYKVQARDGVSLVWRDHRKEAFDDEASAQAYRKTIPVGIETRVVRWERSGSTPLKDTGS